MMKTMIYAAAFTLSFVALVPDAQAITIKDDSRLTHVVSSGQFPEGKMRFVRHTFLLQISQEDSAISQLSIGIPLGLALTDNISVSDPIGRKIDASILLKDNKIIMVFSQPVAPGTRLNIAINDVKIVGISNAWLYRIYAKFVGIDAEFPLGVAQVRVY